MTDPVWTPDLLASPHDASDKADRVRRMFDSIAPRYEFVNTVCSAGRDAHWRRAAVRLADVRSDDDVLDVACGTGDFARAFLAVNPRRVVGVDFAHEMLLRAVHSPTRDTNPGPHSVEPLTHWVEADALRLPFRDGSFSIVSCAFGVRNFADLEAGLREMHRVLRPGGRAIILEFTRPGNPVARRLYEFYASRVMPLAATWLSGDRGGAYRYLPRSVVSFLTTGQMVESLRRTGFARAQAAALTLGVVTVYRATRDRA